MLRSNYARQPIRSASFWYAGTRENLRRAIAVHAPIAWAHINMLGEYDFAEEKLKDALGILPLKSAA